MDFTFGPLFAGFWGFFMKTATRAWQRMLSGRRLNLLNPTPVDIEIEDIAHGLSRLARWNGQTNGVWAYSVAEHSLLVERILRAQNEGIGKRWQKACLLHDAPEYVIGDMITPFKAFLGVDYTDIDARLGDAIHLRFGLPGDLPQWVKKAINRADKTAAYLEAIQLAGFSQSEAKRYIANPKTPPEIRINPMPPDEAKAAYLKRFHDIES